MLARLTMKNLDIAITSYQLFTLVVTAYGVQFSSSVMTFSTPLSLVNFSVYTLLRFGCSAHINQFLRLLMVTLVPMGLLGGLTALVVALRRLTHSDRAQRVASMSVAAMFHVSDAFVPHLFRVLGTRQSIRICVK